MRGRALDVAISAGRDIASLGADRLGLYRQFAHEGPATCGLDGGLILHPNYCCHTMDLQYTDGRKDVAEGSSG